MRRSVCNLRHQAADALGRAGVGLVAHRSHKLGQHIIGLEEALGSGTLIGEFGGRLLPRAVDFAEHVIVRNESILKNDFVELIHPAHLLDLIAGDALGLHGNEERRQAVPAIFLGRRRGAEQADHVVGLVRVRGPDLGAVDQVAAVGLGRLGLGGEQIRAGARLAHTDAELNLALDDARQDIGFDLLRTVLDDGRAALPVGGEVDAGRRVGDAKLFGQNIAFEEAALAPAVFLRPGHADPALGRHAFGELPAVGGFAPARIVRIERALGDLLGKEGAGLLPQGLAGFGQADRVECQCGGHAGSSLRSRIED